MSADALHSAHVVATVHSPAGLAAARRLHSGDVDLVELRVDAFAREPEQLQLLVRAASGLPLPLIITVRHPLEGGAGALSAQTRRALFEKFLPHAAFVDVELRSVKELAPVLIAARENGSKIILSHHDFKKTPSRPQLSALVGKAHRAGADIFKVATVASEPRELATLLDFLTREMRRSGRPLLSVMAMGTFGKISRLLFAKTGSALNYGFLDQSNASGQWPAKLLKARLGELEN